MIALANAEVWQNFVELAQSYNKHRTQCNAATNLPDGIQDRKKDMTTELPYKTILLKECNERDDPAQKLKCIEGNVWLKTGRVNYVNYVGTRRQSNTCNKLKGIDGCEVMCREFFQFWREPTEEVCGRVEEEWYDECQLRVQLIAEKAASQWDAADTTQGKLDNLFPDLEPVWAPISVRPAKVFNPWLAAQTTVDISEAELQRLRGAFAAQESAVNKCSLLGGWHDRKKEILEEGFKRQHQLVEVKNWHDNEAAKLSEFHIDRKSAIENAKIFYDQSETEVQKAYASAAENARAALAVNQSEYALFLSQNERKLVSLRELASAKCRLGSGVCYEPEANCNLLL
jgi:hypothetical protein